MNNNEKLEKLKNNIDNNSINENLIDIENKDSEYLTKNNENGSPTDEGSSTTDIEINPKVLEHELIQNKYVNYENYDNYLDKIENTVFANEMLEVNNDEDSTYVVEEIKHSYDDALFYTEFQKWSTENINDEETRKLINELNNLKLYDPKIDVLFKTIFKNDDLILSLLNSILPEDEKIVNFNTSSEEIIYFPQRKSKTKKIIADLYLKGISKRKNSSEFDNSHFVVEMQIKKKEDIVLRAEITIHGIVFNDNNSSLNKFQYKGRICSFNFIFYNLDEKKDDPLYIHKMYENENNDHKFEIYVIELKKFKNQFDISKLKELANKVYGNNNEGPINFELKKELKKQLWLAFLSKVNINYSKNNKELLKKYENYGEEKLKEIKGQKYKIYIKNEIELDLYKLFKNEPDIMKAIGRCEEQMTEEDAHKYYKLVSTEEEIDELKGKIKNMGEQIKDRDEQIKNMGEQIKDRDEQIKDRDEQIKDRDDQIKDRDEQIKNMGEQIKDWDEKMKIMRKENEELKNLTIIQSNNKDEQIKDLNEKVKNTNKEIEDLKNMVSMLINMMKRKNNENDKREDDEDSKRMKFK
eukprot:jgi/Orpsp1_1/1183586/evm.model.c7180000085809.1